MGPCRVQYAIDTGVIAVDKTTEAGHQPRLGPVRIMGQVHGASSFTLAARSLRQQAKRMNAASVLARSPSYPT
ncbi:hypothetical protein GCM10027296_05540 [Chitinimonas naiadis]